MNWEKYLLRCDEIAWAAVEAGNTPFGALIVDKDGNILIEQGNIELTDKKVTGHAETTVVEKAFKKYPKEFLKELTLVTSVEPCVMCAGAIYWSNIGRVVYGLSEVDLLSLTVGNEINPTLNLSCRDVFKTGQRNIEVIGPFENLKERLLDIHRNYWRNI